MLYKDINFGLLKIIVIPPLKLMYGLEVEGRENLIEGKAIIASNHLSYLDPVLIPAALYKQIHFVSRQFSPFLDNLLRSIGQIVLNGTKLNKETLREAKAVLEQRRYLGIFPEGTRSYDGKFGEIKEGIAYLAYSTETPIIPLAIRGTYEIWPRHEKYPKSYGKFKVRVGKAIYPPLYNGENKKKIISELTKIIKLEIENLLC